MSGRILILCALGPLLLISEYAGGQTPPGDEAVAEAREALAETADFPWYDPASDGIRRIDVEPPRDLAARKSKWEVQPPANWSWPEWLSTVLRVFGWIALAVCLGLLIFLITRAAMGDGLRGGQTSSYEDAMHGDIDRIEALPFQLQRPQSDLLAEARRHYEAGNYGEAVIYLYSYQLVELDRHRIIRLTKGKTNRQYLREVRPRRPLFNVLYETMVMFEDVFFGRHSVQRDRFERSWRQLDEFHKQLGEVAT